MTDDIGMHAMAEIEAHSEPTRVSVSVVVRDVGYAR